MLEVEVKYAQREWNEIQAQLLQWGVERQPFRVDVDQYFNAPDRDFALTDEAVRLRRIGVKNYLTYKGPKRDTTTKTRKEIELPLADGDTPATLAADWLISLGYRSVATVRKQREIWTFQRDGFTIEACFDAVEKVGRFVELEIQAEEADYESAKAVLLAVAAQLGLQQQERQSYLRMLLSQQSPS